MQHGNFGLALVHNPLNYSADVIFVHGPKGNLFSTWETKSGEFWLEWLGGRLPQIRVWSYGYNARTESGSQDVFHVFATQFLKLSRHLSDQSTGTIEKPIVFVAHSLGGILVKKAMILASSSESGWNCIFRNTAGIIFLATPHRGSRPLAPVAALTFNFSPGSLQLLSVLQANPSTLAEIAEEFSNIWGSRPLFSFRETTMTHGIMVVPQENAITNCQTETVIDIPWCNHSEISKPDSTNSVLFTRILDSLISLLQPKSADAHSSTVGSYNPESLVKLPHTLVRQNPIGSIRDGGRMFPATTRPKINWAGESRGASDKTSTRLAAADLTAIARDVIRETFPKYPIIPKSISQRRDILLAARTVKEMCDNNESIVTRTPIIDANPQFENDVADLLLYSALIVERAADFLAKYSPTWITSEFSVLGKLEEVKDVLNRIAPDDTVKVDIYKRMLLNALASDLQIHSRTITQNIDSSFQRHSVGSQEAEDFIKCNPNWDIYEPSNIANLTTLIEKHSVSILALRSERARTFLDILEQAARSDSIATPDEKRLCQTYIRRLSCRSGLQPTDKTSTRVAPADLTAIARDVVQETCLNFPIILKSISQRRDIFLAARTVKEMCANSESIVTSTPIIDAKDLTNPQFENDVADLLLYSALTVEYAADFLAKHSPTLIMSESMSVLDKLGEVKDMLNHIAPTVKIGNHKSELLNALASDLQIDSGTVTQNIDSSFQRHSVGSQEAEDFIVYHPDWDCYSQSNIANLTTFIERNSVSILALRSGHAQIFLDILEQAARSDSIATPDEKRRYQTYLRRLSCRSGLHPSTFHLTDVEPTLCTSKGGEHCAQGKQQSGAVQAVEGGFGTVRHAKWKKPSGEVVKVAIKTLTRHDQETFCHEAAFWHYLDADKVVPFYGVTRIANKNTPELCLVSQWMDGGRICCYVDNKDDSICFNLLHQVADGIKYLHGLNLVHGDIKPANILIDTTQESLPKALIMDFGSSNAAGLTNVSHSTPYGYTPGYVGDSANFNRWNPSNDVYAFGVTCCQVIMAKRWRTIASIPENIKTYVTASTKLRSIPEDSDGKGSQDSRQDFIQSRLYKKFVPDKKTDSPFVHEVCRLAAFTCSTPPCNMDYVVDFFKTSERQSESVADEVELDPEPRIPWLEPFHLLCGVDALSGEPKASPLTRPTAPDKFLQNVGPVSTQVAVNVIREIHHESRIAHKFEPQGTVNSMPSFVLSDSFASRGRYVPSSHSFIVETVISGEYEFQKLDLEGVEFMTAALELSHDEFCDTYGDYFVLGYKRRYWFHALVECSSNGVANNQNIEASAKLEWENLLGIQTGAKFGIGDFKFDLNARACVLYSGCNIPNSRRPTRYMKAPSFTCQDVIQIAKSIMSTKQPGMNEIALLASYSRVLHSHPNTVPVSRGSFDTLHKMNATAIGLLYDTCHPAFTRYEDIASDARTAAELLWRHRSSYIDDDTAREETQRLLDDAAGKVHGLLVRYQFLESLVTEWLGRPWSFVIFRGEDLDADQKWSPKGRVPTDDRDDKPVVSLTDGTMVHHVKVEGRFALTIFDTINFLHFECREIETQAVSPERQKSSAVVLPRPPCYIVGWTMSCKTSDPESVSFSVESGGILKNRLTLRVMGSPSRANWRCDIYFVDREDYNFPHLYLDRELDSE